MISVSPALAAIIAGRKWVRAEVCRIVLPDDPVPILLSTAAYPVVAPGQTYPGSGPLMTRGDIVREAGLKSQTLELRITPRPADQIYGRSWRTCLKDGIFDGASVTYSFAFMPLDAPGDASAGLIQAFVGTIGDAYPRGLELIFQCDDPLKVLDTPYPVQVYQTQCPNVLFDARCGLDKADFLETETVNASPTVMTIPITNSRPDGYFDRGQIRFTSGPCRGIRRMIRTWDGATLTLGSALPRPPLAGDTIELLPGCLKTQANCVALGNDRHRGFPHVPKAETAI